MRGADRLAVLASLFAAVVGLSAPAASAADAEGITITAEPGMDGFIAVGEPIPVRITVTTDHTTRGTVRLSDNGGPPVAVVERDLEVAAGTSKSFWMVLPDAGFFGPPNSPTVEYTERNDRTASEPLRFLPAGKLIGVLPQLAAAAPPLGAITLTGDRGEIRVGPLTVEQLELGTTGLEMFSGLAASRRDLAGLSPPAKAALFQWVNQGGQLLIDDDPAGEVPAAWLPGSAGYALAGSGEVWATDGALARGEWDPFVTIGSTDPNNPRGGFKPGFAGPGFFPGNGIGALADDAGLRLNRLGMVLLILAGYVVLVGPVMFFVLRRARRLPAGWAAIPALAVLTTGLVVVAGTRSRQGADAAHVTIYDTSAAGTRANVSTLVVARSGGRNGVRLPVGWSPANDALGWNFGGDRATQRIAGDGSELTRSLGSGQAALLSAAGPSAAPDGSLSVEATSAADGAVSGTVRNIGSIELVDVAVFSGERAVLVGTLAAGAAEPFELSRVTESAGISPADQVWLGSSNQFGPGATVVFGPEGGPAGPRGAPAPVASLESTLADPALWNQAQPSQAVSKSYGIVTAAGWMRAAAPLRTARGGSIRVGRAAVTVTAPVRPAGRVTDITVRRELVSQPNGFGPNGAASVTYRYLLPPETRSGAVLEIVAPDGTESVEAWDGSQWQAVAVQGGTGALPSGSVRSGIVLVRAQVALGGPFGGASLAELVVRERPT